MDVLDLGVRDLAGVTTVVHLAARKSVPASFENRDDIARNVLVDRHLVEIVARAHVRRLLVASSCEVYGARAVGVPIAEAVTFAPRSPYAVSKVALEHLADVYARPDAETTALRFFNVYGPDEGLDAVVPRFIAEIRATGGLTIEDDGEQRRDFNYVDDVVDMVVQIVQYDRRLPRAINVGSGRSRSIRELAGIVLGLGRWRMSAHRSRAPQRDRRLRRVHPIARVARRRTQPLARGRRRDVLGRDAQRARRASIVGAHRRACGSSSTTSRGIPSRSS